MRVTAVSRSGSSGRVCGGGGLVLLVFIISIPLLQGIKLDEYEFVVGNGNRMLFFSSPALKSVDKSPLMNVVVTEPGTKTRIISILPNVTSNILYFTTTTKDMASISIFYPAYNKTRIIHTGPKGTIGTLAFMKNHLIWANPTNRSVWCLLLNAKTNNLTNPTPQLLFQDTNATFDSIAVHPATSRILYTRWRRSNESEILSYSTITNTSSTLITSVFQPRGLLVTGNQLYWIDNPPGIYFNLEQAELLSQPNNNSLLSSPILTGDSDDGKTNNRGRILLLKDQNQHPFALAVACSTLFWTDLMNKVLVSWVPSSKTFTPLLSFNNTPPHALALLNPICAKASVSATPTPALSTPSAPTTIKQSTAAVPRYQTPPENPQRPLTNLSILSEGEARNVLFYANFSICQPSESRLCLNGASCIKLHHQLHCLCSFGFSGPSCGEDTNLLQEVAELSKQQHCSGSSSGGSESLVVALIGSCVIILVLLLVIGILVVRLRRQSKKPTIRRRVVVSHRSDLDTNSNPSSVTCEMIDIENCCNMNVCETPCYERLGSFSSGGGTSSSGGGGRVRKTSVKEDKKCLLTN